MDPPGSTKLQRAAPRFFFLFSSLQYYRTLHFSPEIAPKHRTAIGRALLTAPTASYRTSTRQLAWLCRRSSATERSNTMSSSSAGAFSKRSLLRDQATARRNHCATSQKSQSTRPQRPESLKGSRSTPPAPRSSPSRASALASLRHPLDDPAPGDARSGTLLPRRTPSTLPGILLLTDSPKDGNREVAHAPVQPSGGDFCCVHCCVLCRVLCRVLLRLGLLT